MSLVSTIQISLGLIGPFKWKRRVLKCLVWTVLTYGAETWAMKKDRPEKYLRSGAAEKE